ncbi:MAG: thiol-disulfide oxidoreductase DCC family protein [Myxococcota bacterium]|nr:DCC1-like thiol-disulfide oxidoreductase family protein [Myxococcota bacterium]
MPAVILYDGVCGLCDRLVRFILRRDQRRAFRFATLQSNVARRILNTYGRDPDRLDTFYLVIGYGTPHERLEAKSRAALSVFARLGKAWPLVLLLRLVPSFIADVVYDLVARFRYRIFGKHEACPAPSREDRAHFLDAALD